MAWYGQHSLKQRKGGKEHLKSGNFQAASTIFFTIFHMHSTSAVFLKLKSRVIRIVFEILASSIRTFLHIFWRETNFARSPLCTYEGGPLTSKACNSTHINVNSVFLFTVSSIRERRKVPQIPCGWSQHQHHNFCLHSRTAV